MDRYITHYDHLCSDCNRAILMCYNLISDGLADDEYINDREGPNMMAYDLGMLHFDACPDELMDRGADRREELTRKLVEL